VFAAMELGKKVDERVSQNDGADDRMRSMDVAKGTLIGLLLGSEQCACRHRSTESTDVAPEPWTLAAPSAPATTTTPTTVPKPVSTPSQSPDVYKHCWQTPTGGCPENGRICLYGRIPGYADECPDCDQHENDCWFEEDCPGGKYSFREPHCLRARCPKSSAGVTSAACTLSGASCWYDDLRCQCRGGVWSCAKVDCPKEPPVLGSKCSSAWARCRYGVRCEEGTNFEEYRVCRNGVWEEGTYSCAAE